MKITALARHVWILLIVVGVAAAGAVTVSRLRSILGSERRPAYTSTSSDDAARLDTRHLTYEVFGPPGTVASISYFDADAKPQHIAGERLPWTLDLVISQASIVGTVVAQGGSGEIGCRIAVDGHVETQKTVREVNAFASCVLTLA